MIANYFKNQEVRFFSELKGDQTKIKKPNLQTHIEISFETMETKKLTKVSKKLLNIER